MLRASKNSMWGTPLICQHNGTVTTRASIINRDALFAYIPPNARGVDRMRAAQVRMCLAAKMLDDGISGMAEDFARNGQER